MMWPQFQHLVLVFLFLVSVQRQQPLLFIVLSASAETMYDELQEDNSTTPDNLTLICKPCSFGEYSTPLCAIPINEPNTSTPVCKVGFCIPQLNCSLCEPGTYQNEQWQNKCLSCIPGFYNSRSGQINCPPCPRGTYCPFCSTIIPLDCEIGRYCPDTGATKGILCPPGYKCIGQGNQRPTICEAGYYCIGGDAIPAPCSVNSYCGVGCSECKPCYTPFWESTEASSECRVTFVLYVVVGLGILVIGLLILFVYTSLRKRKNDDEYARAEEITALIPRAEGPKYTGL